MSKVIGSFLVLVVWGTAVFAANLPPDQLVRETTDKVLSELTKNRDELTSDTEKLYALVSDLVLPHFDFTRMSRLVLGKHWRNATQAQQEQFVGEFRTLLVRTYATALVEYSGEDIIYKPVRINDDGSRAVVRTELQSNGGSNVPVHYSLRKSSDGAWKVFDIKIDGISLVTNYRSSYAQIVRAKGMKALIESLADRNKRNKQLVE